MMRIIFMGTPVFAVPCLEALVQSEEEIIGVVTQPDRPRGRGKQVMPSPVKENALRYGLPVYQPRRVRESEFLTTVQELQPDLIVVVAFGQILPGALLQIPRYGCINVHASLLPRYRGAAPIHWAVLNGETETGITTMLMDEGLDTGDILLQARIAIGENDTTGMVHDRLAQLGATVLLQTITELKAGTLKRRSQTDALASYAPMLSAADEIIDWSRPATVLHNQIRGLNPWPGAYTTLSGVRCKIWEATVWKGSVLQTDAQPGQVIQLQKNAGIIVQTGEGHLLLKVLQPANSKRMQAVDFVRGYRLQPGDIFGLDPGMDKVEHED